MLDKIIAEVEALKVEDDSTGLKQNFLLDKVLEILRKPQEPCEVCKIIERVTKKGYGKGFLETGSGTAIFEKKLNYCPNCGRKLEG